MGPTEAPGGAMERRARACDAEFWPRIEESSCWSTEHRARYVQPAAESRARPARRATQLRLVGGEGAPPDTEHRARFRPPQPAPRAPRAPRPQSALRAFGWPREEHCADVERRHGGARLRASSGGRSFGSTSKLPRIRERSLPRRGKARTSKSSESSRKQSLVQLSSPRRRPVLPPVEQRPAFRMAVHQDDLNPRIRWTRRRSHSPAFVVLHRSI